MNTAAAIATAAARPCIAVVCCTFGLLVSGPAFATSPAPPAAIQEAHSAVWFDAENPGTGWVLEMLRDDRGAVYWYGFDEAGQPVWRIGAGRVEGDGLSGRSLIVDDLYTGSGARFGAAFDPDDVVLERVGSAAMSFRDCDRGSVTVETEAGMTTEPLDRLTETMGAGRPFCVPVLGEPGFPVRAYAGESGAWYDPARGGEGFTLQWMKREEAVLYWFTYDLEGNPLWLFGVGAREDGEIVFPNLHSAVRDPDGDVQLTDWGSLSLDLACDSGTLRWTSVVDGYGEGSRDVIRLNTLDGLACPTVTPPLTAAVTGVREVPIPIGRDIVVREIAPDGTVLGLERGDDVATLVTLGPQPDAEWVTLGGPAQYNDIAVDEESRHFLSDSGRVALAGKPVEGGGSRPGRFAPEFSTAIDDFPSGGYQLLGASADRRALTGRDSENRPWAWDEDNGLRSLPVLWVDPDNTLGAAVAAANPRYADNRRSAVVGFESVPVVSALTPFNVTGFHALRWDGDGEPHYLRDDEGRLLAAPAVCSADCGIVYGVDTNDVLRDGPRLGQPWFWTEDRRFGVLEGLENVERLRPVVHVLADVSDDGTLVVGTTVERMTHPIAGPGRAEAFFWTQATGLVDLEPLLVEAGVLDGIYRSTEVVALGGGRLLVYVRGVPLVLTLSFTPTAAD